jgi:hypothetical protein
MSWQWVAPSIRCERRVVVGRGVRVSHLQWRAKSESVPNCAHNDHCHFHCSRRRRLLTPEILPTQRLQTARSPQSWV